MSEVAKNIPPLQIEPNTAGELLPEATAGIAEAGSTAPTLQRYFYISRRPNSGLTAPFIRTSGTPLSLTSSLDSTLDKDYIMGASIIK